MESINRKFKIGDRVRVHARDSIFYDLTGVIVEFPYPADNRVVRIKFDELDSNDGSEGNTWESYCTLILPITEEVQSLYDWLSAS